MGRIRDGATIKIRPETRSRLLSLGIIPEKSSTYDDVINKLIDHYEETKS